MYSFPSASQMCEPSPRTINGGVPPTARYARTGEFTPPGMTFFARSNSASDFAWFIATFSGNVLARDQPVQEEPEHRLAYRAVQSAQNPALQAEIRLRPRKQILHERAEP